MSRTFGWVILALLGVALFAGLAKSLMAEMDAVQAVAGALLASILYTSLVYGLGWMEGRRQPRP